MQRAREQSPTELAQLCEEMDRFLSIDSVDKQLRKVEYNLSRLDGQVELLKYLHFSGKTSFLQALAPSGKRTFFAMNVNGPKKCGRNFVF